MIRFNGKNYDKTSEYIDELEKQCFQVQEDYRNLQERYEQVLIAFNILTSDVKEAREGKLYGK